MALRVSMVRAKGFEPNRASKFPSRAGWLADGLAQVSSNRRSGGRFSIMASMLKKPVTVDSSKSVISF